MNQFYQQEERQLIAVDCIIFGFENGKLNLLLLKRNMEPGKGSWSLAGGFLRRSESLYEAACRVLCNLTGLKDVYLEQLNAYGEPNRDPGDRVVSITYYALLKVEDYNENLLAENGAHWRPIEEIPELIFDHREMVDKSLRRLRRKAKSQPIGFELLPEKFTLPQLQSLYEAIYQKELDKRNFRKKILSMQLLDKLDEKDKTSSKKGAYLYKFNQKKYQQLLADGFYFSLDV
jgi:8-oxo-dGTP diphosphatase